MVDGKPKKKGGRLGFKQIEIRLLNMRNRIRKAVYVERKASQSRKKQLRTKVGRGTIGWNKVGRLPV
jgi:hypothetical protein